MTTRIDKITRIAVALAEAIKDVGSVQSKYQNRYLLPSGHLYAAVMQHVSFDEYTTAIAAMKRCGMVSERNNLLVWNKSFQSE